MPSSPRSSAVRVAWTPTDRRRLARARAAAPTVALYRRLDAVLLVAHGHSITAAAAHVGSARSSVHRWVRQYQRHRDPTALRSHASPGRPRVAPTLTRRAVLTVLQQSPWALGYTATTWTVPLLVTHVRAQTGISISVATLRRRLHQWGIRAKRPRYVYSGKAEHLPQKKGPSFGACGAR